MVLHGRLCGRVGQRRDFYSKPPHSLRRFFFVVRCRLLCSPTHAAPQSCFLISPIGFNKNIRMPLQERPHMRPLPVFVFTAHPAQQTGHCSPELFPFSPFVFSNNLPLPLQARTHAVPQNWPLERVRQPGGIHETTCGLYYGEQAKRYLPYRSDRQSRQARL